MWKKPKVVKITRQPSHVQIMIDKKKQVENVERLNCLNSMMTNDARCKHEYKSRISMAKASFNKKTFHQQIELNLLAPEFGI